MRRILDDSSLDPQTKADLIWKDFNVFVEAFLLQTARLSPVSMRATRRAKRGKGTPAVFRQINQAVRKPYDNGAPNRLRVLYRLLGRMQELAFRRIRQQAIPSELQLKLQRCPSWTPQLTIAEVKQQMSDLETHQRESRIRHWENRLRGSQKEVFAWLKRVKSPPTHMIFNDEGELGLGEPAAVSTQDALEKIKSFWYRECSQNEILPEEYFQLWDIPARNPECWAPVDTESIIKSARRQKHKSGGTDGWTGTEVSLFPSCMWRDIAVLFGWFEVLGHFPQIWGEVRQAHLMKSHAPRSSDGAVPASKMRPIAVMSVWYRMYTGALLRTSQAQDWINSVLDPVQHGCRQKHDCLQAVVPLASAQAQGHFIWSLDLSQAFDRLRPEVALSSLTHFGFPSLLANAFQKIWSSQRRVLQWQGESFPVPCHVASSVPQGDPLSPWAMNVVLRTPTAVIRRLHPTGVLSVFMDDRSFSAEPLETGKSIWEAWKNHSACLGLRENLAKTQIFSRTQDGQFQIRSDPETAPWAKDALVALGVSFTPLGCKPTQ